MAAEQPRMIVVLGSTGNQGRGVISALLSNEYGGGAWHVRAITRDPNSPQAQQVLKQYQTEDSRLALVAGIPYDVDSLRQAFAGAYGVFAMTHEIYPGRILTKDEEMLHEREAGENMVRVAKECGVKHFVFSSLPDVVDASGGRFQSVHHMNNKVFVEKLARRELDCVSAVIPGFYYSNLRWPQYTQLRPDGVVRFVTPIAGSQVAQWTDPVHDMGAFVAKIFGLGVEATRGKTYIVLAPRITAHEMVEVFTRVTGRPAVHDPITAAEWAKMTAPFVGPAFEEDAKQMMEWAAIWPKDKICYGSMSPEEDKYSAELGLRASTFEEWLKRSGWTGPIEVYQPGL